MFFLDFSINWDAKLKGEIPGNFGSEIFALYFLDNGL